MFKILLLQAMHGRSDERTEYLIKDRLSFMRFLGLGLADAVPDANTIWTYREALKRAGVVEALFAGFDAALRATGWLAMGGQIVDATNGRLVIRCIGLARTTARIALTNLAYNMRRLVWIEGRSLPA